MCHTSEGGSRLYRSVSRVCRLGYGLLAWQKSRCFGIAVVAMCLTLAFGAADMCYSVAMEQTKLSVASTYRGFRIQIVPDGHETHHVPAAVAVETDEVRLVAGSRSVDAGRSRVGWDDFSVDKRAAQFGLLVSGRHPCLPSEISLSEAAADRLAVDVGDGVQIGTEVFAVVGIFVLPANPRWVAVAGIAAPAVEEPTSWLTDRLPEELGDTGYQANSVEFEAMVAGEAIDRGPLGFVRYYRPVFLIIAACLYAFLTMLFSSGVTAERRGLTAAGMSHRQANAVVAVACALSTCVGALIACVVLGLVFWVAPQLVSRLWDMRWCGVGFQVRPATLLFAAFMVCIPFLLPALPRGRSAVRRSLRKRPLPRFVGMLALLLCGTGILLLAYPRSRAQAEMNWWLGFAGAALLAACTPFAFAAATGRSRQRTLVYVRKQRSRRALTGILILALITFAATVAATKYAHGSQVQEAWYQPPQPVGSLAVREVTDAGVLRELADANPGQEFSTRGDSTGLLVVRPSIARAIEALPEPIDEGTMLSGLDPDLTIDNGSTVGNVGEPGEVWTIDLRPDDQVVLAAPSYIEDGQVVIGRVREGRFIRLATVAATPGPVLTELGTFPDAVVASLAVYGGVPSPYRSIALLGFSDLSEAEQGQLEGLARSIAPTAFVEADAGYQDGGFYAFSQFLGYGAAIIVGLIAIALGLQLVSEEREFRRLAARCGLSRRRRRMAGAAALLPLSASIVVASLAGLAFTRDTGLPEIAGFGYTPLAFVLAALAVDVALALVHAREPR